MMELAIELSACAGVRLLTVDPGRVSRRTRATHALHPPDYPRRAQLGPPSTARTQPRSRPRHPGSTATTAASRSRLCILRLGFIQGHTHAFFMGYGPGRATSG